MAFSQFGPSLHFLLNGTGLVNLAPPSNYFFPMVSLFGTDRTQLQINPSGHELLKS